MKLIRALLWLPPLTPIGVFLSRRDDKEKKRLKNEMYRPEYLR